MGTIGRFAIGRRKRLSLIGKNKKIARHVRFFVYIFV